MPSADRHSGLTLQITAEEELANCGDFTSSK